MYVCMHAVPYIPDAPTHTLVASLG